MKVIIVKNGKSRLILIPENESEALDVQKFNGATVSLVRSDLTILHEKINGSLMIEEDKKDE
jgi:hypothetical protein